MSRLGILRTLFLLILLLPACSRREATDQAPELILEMEVIPSPPTVGASLLMITIKNPDGEPIKGFKLDARGDMSHAGMTPVIVQQVAGEAGIFTVPFEWTMAGDWIVTLSATLPDGRSLIRSQTVQVEP